MNRAAWRIAAIFFLATTVLTTLVLFNVLPRPSFISKNDNDRTAAKADGFEAFEGVAFAREFSERFLTFDSRTFKVSQIATAFLLDEENRAKRISDVERLDEKIARGEVSQRARLMTLVKLSGNEEHFRADLDVEISEGAAQKAAKSEFRTRLEFDLQRVDRSAQNPWGFIVEHLKQEVLNPSVKTEDAASVFMLRPGVATLVRLPCSIENVELPKGTSVRVKLTTFDISELQLKTDVPLGSEQTLRAICRERAFHLKVVPELKIGEPLVVLKSLKMENAVPVVNAAKAKSSGKKLPKTGVEKSIEEQLGFIVEE